jgi:hypothetical protein
MPEPMSDKHYEEKFEFPLWKLIKQRAEKKDISYLAASEEVVPEYVKTIRYGDREFEEAEIGKWAGEMAKIEREQPETKL